MQVIHKVQIEVTSEFGLGLPTDAKVLDIQIQDGKITVWYECNCDEAGNVGELLGARHYRVIGTGRPFEAVRGRHVKTVQQGTFVWHIYEIW